MLLAISTSGRSLRNSVISGADTCSFTHHSDTCWGTQRLSPWVDALGTAGPL